MGMNGDPRKKVVAKLTCFTVHNEVVHWSNLTCCKLPCYVLGLGVADVKTSHSYDYSQKQFPLNRLTLLMCSLFKQLYWQT